MLLITRLSTGGAERVALELTRQLVAGGHEMHVATVYSGGDLRDQAAAAACQLHDGLAVNRFDLRCIWRMRKLIRRHGIDALLIVDATRANLLCGVYGALLAGRRCGRVLWMHNCPTGSDDLRLPGFLPRLKRMVPLLHRLVPVGEWLGRLLISEGLPAGKIEPIPNGIDLQRYRLDISQARARAELDLPDRGRLVIQVGNRWPTREPRWLLEAFAAAGVPDAGLVLVGQGTDAPDVAAAARELGLEGRVFLRGPTTEVPLYLRACDVFALASTYETHSLGVLEALAAGLPVIVPDIPAFQAGIDHGENALKHDPAEPAELAEALGRVLSEPGLAGRLAEAGQRTVQHYSAEAMARRFEDLLSVYGPAAGGEGEPGR